MFLAETVSVDEQEWQEDFEAWQEDTAQWRNVFEEYQQTVSCNEL